MLSLQLSITTCVTFKQQVVKEGEWAEQDLQGMHTAPRSNLHQTADILVSQRSLPFRESCD